MNSEYKNKLDTAREELAQMFHKRSELDIKIAKQQRKVAYLAGLADETEETDELLELGLTGLTNACRSVLRAAPGKALTPIEIRDRIVHLHFPIDQYKNILASIHNTLKRLVESKEIRAAKLLDGKDAYVWVPMYGAPSSLANQMEDMRRDKERKRKK